MLDFRWEPQGNASGGSEKYDPSQKVVSRLDFTVYVAIHTHKGPRGDLKMVHNQSSSRVMMYICLPTVRSGSTCRMGSLLQQQSNPAVCQVHRDSLLRLLQGSM